MKNLLLPWFSRCWTAAVLLLAGSPLPSPGQSYSLGFGRVEVDLTLDAGLTPSTTFSQFFSSAAENVVTGVGGLVDGSVNISGQIGRAHV